MGCMACLRGSLLLTHYCAPDQPRNTLRPFNGAWSIGMFFFCCVGFFAGLCACLIQAYCLICCLHLAGVRPLDTQALCLKTCCSHLPGLWHKSSKLGVLLAPCRADFTGPLVCLGDTMLTLHATRGLYVRYVNAACATHGRFTTYPYIASLLFARHAPPLCTPSALMCDVSLFET